MNRIATYLLLLTGLFTGTGAEGPVLVPVMSCFSSHRDGDTRFMLFGCGGGRRGVPLGAVGLTAAAV